MKAKVVIESLKGHMPANEIASEFETCVTKVNTWKKQLLRHAIELFGQAYRNSRRIMSKNQAGSVKR